MKNGINEITDSPEFQNQNIFSFHDALRKIGTDFTNW